MLGKVDKLVRYKVTVIKTRSKHVTPFAPELTFSDEMHAAEHDEDTYFGYGRPDYHVGDHFDLWFTPFRCQDSRNYVGFGRIRGVNKAQVDDGYICVTRNGKYLVEEGK